MSVFLSDSKSFAVRSSDSPYGATGLEAERTIAPLAIFCAASGTPFLSASSAGASHSSDSFCSPVMPSVLALQAPSEIPTGMRF